MRRRYVREFRGGRPRKRWPLHGLRCMTLTQTGLCMSTCLLGASHRDDRLLPRHVLFYRETLASASPSTRTLCATYVWVMGLADIASAAAIRGGTGGLFGRCGALCFLSVLPSKSVVREADSCVEADDPSLRLSPAMLSPPLGFYGPLFRWRWLFVLLVLSPSVPPHCGRRRRAKGHLGRV